MPANPPATTSSPSPARTKLKPVRFAPTELPRLTAFLSGRDFSTVVRSYCLGQSAKRGRLRSEGKAEADAAEVSVVVPFTADEWSTVASRLQGRDPVEVVRAHLLQQMLPDPVAKKERPVIERRRLSEFEAATIRQAAWWGNNLNQIARAANIERGVTPSIAAALLRLERLMAAHIRETADLSHLVRVARARPQPEGEEQ